jgi:adenine-specific DNA-methyltransferase
MPTLNWVGKDKVVNHHHDVPFRLLDKKYTFAAQEGTPANSKENRIIHGDNLEVLKSLLPEFEGKVNCIYIDPPYNTGNEGWVYNDAVNDPKIKKWLGQVVGKEGEDLSRHDKWLCMMYPRLKLLHRLLAEDGVIFVSIDDNEQATLKLVMDEIFGAGNFVNSIIWEKRYSPQNAVKWFSESHDFLIVYAKSKEEWHPNLLERSDEMNARYRNPDDDPRGVWKPVDSTAQAGHGTQSQFYALTAPNGKQHTLPNGRCWLYTEPVFQQLVADNRIWFGSTGNNVPAVKRFLTEVKQGTACQTIWKYDDVGHNQEGKKEINDLFPEATVFDTPKPARLLDRVLRLAADQNAIVLDTFAGSGTTAHAVLKLNTQDGGNRRFILCEMMDYAETITAERVRRVMNGYGEGKKAIAGTGGAFDYYSVGPALFKEDKNLNEDVGEAAMRDYVAYTESIPAEKQSDTDNPVSRYMLGASETALWLFYYERDRVTTLNLDFLASLNIKALIDGGGKGGVKAKRKRPENFIVYADKCALDKDFLIKHGITFKRIPRDISRF